MYLEFYRKERLLFSEQNKIFLSDSLTEKVCRKIARHFKFEVSSIYFRGRQLSAYSWYNEKRIRFCHNPSFLLVAHELAHLYNFQKYHSGRHDKKLMKTIEKFLLYCEKKNYFSERLNIIVSEVKE